MRVLDRDGRELAVGDRVRVVETSLPLTDPGDEFTVGALGSSEVRCDRPGSRRRFPVEAGRCPDLLLADQQADREGRG